VLELRPATGPPDISDVTLTAARPGAPAQSVSVDLSPTGAGQFFGTLKLAWTDSCRLEVALARWVWPPHTWLCGARYCRTSL